MRWAAVIAILLSPLILYLLFLRGRVLKRRLLPARCLRCGKCGLRLITAIPLCGGNGRVAWSYHLCSICGAKLTLKHGVWSDTPEEEWVRMNPR